MKVSALNARTFSVAVRSLAARLLVGAAFLGACPANAEEDDYHFKPDAFRITLRGGAFDRSFAAVLTELSRANLIKLHAIADASAGTPGTLFAKSLGLPRVTRLPGGGVTQAIDHYLCSINRHICSEKGQWSYQPSAGSPETTPSCEGPLTRSQVCVPVIELDRGTTLLLVDYNPDIPEDRSIQQIVKQLGSCEYTDAKCKAMIKSLNKGAYVIYGDTVYEKETSAKLLIPSTTYKITSRGGERGIDANWEKDVDAARNNAVSMLGSDPTIKNPGDKIFLEYLLYDASLSPWQPLSDPQDAQNIQALSAINYEAPTLAEGATKNLSFLFEDGGKVEWTHCDFEAKPKMRAGEPCASANIDGIANMTGDNHATQVAGVYAARKNNWGVTGIDPFSELRMFKIDPGSTDPFSDNFTAQASLQTPSPPYVLNFSYRHPGSVNFRDLLGFVAGSNFLLIASAGNDGKEINLADAQAKCNIYPACLSALAELGTAPQNLLSVVALNGEGKAVLNDADCPGMPSNFGKVFDVAAPGVFFSPAVSASGTNSLARFCGTSAAAPVVSGLASLIIQAAQSAKLKPTPIAVHDRIAATADLKDRPTASLVRFGRVNFARALKDMNKDLITVHCDGNPEGCTEEENLPDKADIILSMKRGAENIDVPLIDVRRLSRVDPFAQGERLMFDAVFRMNGNLIHDRVSLRADLPLQRSPVQKYQLSAVWDYVSCSFTTECDGTK